MEYNAPNQMVFSRVSFSQQCPQTKAFTALKMLITDHVVEWPVSFVLFVKDLHIFVRDLPAYFMIDR